MTCAGVSIFLNIPLDEESSIESIRDFDDLSLGLPEKLSASPALPPSVSGKIRVILADDHPVTREGLSRMFDMHSDIEVVGEASDGEQAVHITRKTGPDVILMDINMPNMDGLEATKIIHSEFPHIRIIGLSMYDEDDQADAMVNAGASAYRSKSDGTDRLLAAIRGEDQ